MNPLVTFGRFCHYLLTVLAGLPATLLRPWPVLVQLSRYAGGMAAIATTVGIALGVIVWLHVGELARLAPAGLLPSVLTVAVVSELGPVLIGLIAAGRLASGIAAELAAMRITEQVDALRLSGVSPVRRLALPRVAACVLLLPLLTVLADFAAVLGSFLAEAAAGDMSATLYVQYALDRLHPAEAVLATLKTCVFGLLIGVLATWHGLTCAGDTAAVGRAATDAVVQSTVTVLLIDVVLVRAIQLAT